MAIIAFIVGALAVALVIFLSRIEGHLAAIRKSLCDLDSYNQENLTEIEDHLATIRHAILSKLDPAAMRSIAKE
jgi:hypothetical protein